MYHSVLFWGKHTCFHTKNDEHFTNGYQVTGNDVGYGNRDDYGYDFLDSSLNNDANNGSLQRNKTLNQIINYGAIDFMEDFEN